MQTEKERVVGALKGWQWVRGTHGCLFDRGSADSYYGRYPDPHYGGVGGNSGERVPVSCLLYTSPSPRDYAASRMPSSA